MQKGNACLILLAQDVSPKTAERIRHLVPPEGPPARTLPFSMDEMEQLLRKRIGVAAVTDPGFAGSLQKALGEP